MSLARTVRPLGALIFLLAATACTGGCDESGSGGPITAGLAIGTVRLESEPPGAVVRDGERILGTTPMTLTVLTYDEGHRLTLELQGYAPAELELALEPTEQRTERAVLEPLR